jgi:hypothetical protein
MSPCDRDDSFFHGARGLDSHCLNYHIELNKYIYHNKLFSGGGNGTFGTLYRFSLKMRLSSPE